MSIPTRTRTQVVDRVLGYFRTSFEGRALGTKRFLGRFARAVGLSLWGLQKAVEDVDRDIVPSPDNSTDALDEWAVTLGLPNGKGGRGRRLAIEASGGLSNLTGVLGTSYADGLTATAEDGTEIALSGLVAIAGAPPGYGSVQGKFVAAEGGDTGNLPAGTVCTWDSPPSGADATFTLTSPLSGGLDVEDNPALYARIVARLQTPPRGGVAEDIREWLEDVTGVVAAFVYPLRSGTGTLDAVIVGGGSGQGRVPSTTVQDESQAALDAHVVPGSQAARALLPYAPDDSGHLVKFVVEPSRARFAFDWDDTAASYSVDTWTPGTPSTLKLNTLAPDSLKNEIDAYIAGSRKEPPQLQVISTGSVINVPIGAVAWSDGGGKTTLTLTALPDGFISPTAADAVYAYGPVVATIAAGALALCDTLGPSRASGYGDSISPWNDKLTISGLVAVAENAIDTDGTQLIAEVEPGGVTIDGSALDVRGTDGVNGPELLYLSHVVVAQA